MIKNLLNTPGEHYFFLPGVIGRMEACISVPHEIKGNTIAILGHPHSLKGGTMQNKVVTTLARTFKALGIPSLRFNYRGVGQSIGHFDAGIGESEDMLKIAESVQEEMPEVAFIFAGFSFGGFVAYRTAAQFSHKLLITIAPPVNNFDFTAFPKDPSPWLLVQGDEDEVVPADMVFDFASSRDITVLAFKDTGHFFHGKLTDLKTELLQALQS